MIYICKHFRRGGFYTLIAEHLRNDDNADASGSVEAAVHDADVVAYAVVHLARLALADAVLVAERFFVRQTPYIKRRNFSASCDCVFESIADFVHAHNDNNLFRPENHRRRAVSGAVHTDELPVLRNGVHALDKYVAREALAILVKHLVEIRAVVAVDKIVLRLADNLLQNAGISERNRAADRD